MYTVTVGHPKELSPNHVVQTESYDTATRAAALFHADGYEKILMRHSVHAGLFRWHARHGVFYSSDIVFHSE